MPFQIVHTNDLHNRFPEETLRRIIRPGALILDSGDAIAGSNLLFRKEEPILEKMSRLGYQAMAMGNREFHYARSILARRIAAAKFPILSANVVDLWKRLKLSGSMLLDRGEIRIGIFGLTVVQYPIGSPWETLTGWRFFDPIDVTREMTSRLRAAGASLIFCLSHLGFPADQRLAETGEIDCIFGGHSHTILPHAIRVNQTAIVQGGAYGQFVGNWELEIDMDHGKLKTWKLTGGLVEGG